MDVSVPDPQPTEEEEEGYYEPEAAQDQYPTPSKPYSNPCDCCCGCPLWIGVMSVAAVEMTVSICIIGVVLLAYFLGSLIQPDATAQGPFIGEMVLHGLELLLSILLMIGSGPCVRSGFLCLTWVFGIVLITLGELGLEGYRTWSEGWKAGSTLLVATVIMALFRPYFIYLSFKMASEIEEYPDGVPKLGHVFPYYTAPLYVPAAPYQPYNPYYGGGVALAYSNNAVGVSAYNNYPPEPTPALS